MIEATEAPGPVIAPEAVIHDEAALAAEFQSTRTPGVVARAHLDSVRTALFERHRAGKGRKPPKANAIRRAPVKQSGRWGSLMKFGVHFRMPTITESAWTALTGCDYDGAMGSCAASHR